MTTRMYICIYTHICIYARMRMCTRTCMWVRKHIQDKYMNVFKNTKHTHIHIYMHMCVCAHLPCHAVCSWSTHTHIYILIYIYICIYRSRATHRQTSKPINKRTNQPSNNKQLTLTLSADVCCEPTPALRTRHPT